MKNEKTLDSASPRHAAPTPENMDWLWTEDYFDLWVYELAKSMEPSQAETPPPDPANG